MAASKRILKYLDENKDYLTEHPKLNHGRLSGLSKCTAGEFQENLLSALGMSFAELPIAILYSFGNLSHEFTFVYGFEDGKMKRAHVEAINIHKDSGILRRDCYFLDNATHRKNLVYRLTRSPHYRISNSNSDYMLVLMLSIGVSLDYKEGMFYRVS